MTFADFVAKKPLTRGDLFGEWKQKGTEDFDDPKSGARAAEKLTWMRIRVKRAVKVEVIGNGDITSPEKALEMLDKTGCDHLMIGRGALGRPWIFSEISAVLKGNEAPVIPTGEAL